MLEFVVFGCLFADGQGCLNGVFIKAAEVGGIWPVDSLHVGQQDRRFTKILIEVDGLTRRGNIIVRPSYFVGDAVDGSLGRFPGNVHDGFFSVNLLVAFLFLEVVLEAVLTYVVDPADDGVVFVYGSHRSHDHRHYLKILVEAKGVKLLGSVVGVEAASFQAGAVVKGKGSPFHDQVADRFAAVVVILVIPLLDPDFKTGFINIADPDNGGVGAVAAQGAGHNDRIVEFLVVVNALPLMVDGDFAYLHVQFSGCGFRSGKRNLRRKITFIVVKIVSGYGNTVRFTVIKIGKRVIGMIADINDMLIVTAVVGVVIYPVTG